MAEGAGQITASLTLDVSKFKASIEQAQGAVKKMGTGAVKSAAKATEKLAQSTNAAASAMKNEVKALNRIGRELTTYNEALRHGVVTVDQAKAAHVKLTNEIKSLESTAYKTREGMNALYGAMSKAQGAQNEIVRFDQLSTQMARANQAASGAKTSLGAMFAVMGTGAAGASRSLVMSMTNLTESFQKGMMGGRQLKTFLLGDVMDAFMIASFAASSFGAMAEQATGKAAKAFAFLASKFPPIMAALTLLSAALGYFLFNSDKAKDGTKALGDQADRTVESIRFLEGFNSNLSGALESVDRKSRSAAMGIAVLAGRFRELRTSASFLEEIKKQMQALVKETPGEKIFRAATEENKKHADVARDTRDFYRSQNKALQEQTKHLDNLKNKLAEMRADVNKGGALKAFFLERRIDAATKAVEKHRESVKDASNKYTIAKKNADDYAKSLEKIKKEAEALDEQQKQAKAEERRQKAVQRLIKKYNRLKRLFEVTSASGIEHDVKKAQEFSVEMGKILKTLKKFKGVEAARDFLQVTEDNQFIAEVKRNNKAIDEFKQKTEEAKRNAMRLLRATGETLTIKMGIGTATTQGADGLGFGDADALGMGLPSNRITQDVAKVGRMTARQRIEARIKGKDPELEAFLSKVRDFKKSLTDLGLSSDMATKALNVLPEATLRAVTAMARFAEGVLSTLGDAAMGNFGSFMAGIGGAAGTGLGVAMGLDPATGQAAGSAIGGFADMLLSKMQIPTGAVAADGTAETVGFMQIISDTFEQSLLPAIEAMKPFASVLFFVASRMGKLFGMVFDALGPLIDVLASLFLDQLRGAMAALLVFIPLLEMVGMVFQGLGPTIKFLSRGLTNLVMVVFAIQMVITQFVGGIVGALGSLFTALGLYTETTGFGEKIMEGFNNAVIKAIEGLSGFLKGIGDFLILVAGDNPFFESLKEMGKSLNNAADAMVDAFTADLPGLGEEIRDAAANYREQNENMDKANKEASKVLNAPQGFKVEKYRYEAMSPEQSNPFTGSSLDGSGGMVINIENIFVDDGTDLLDQLNDANQNGGLPGNGGF